ncbi:hypothetical protein [Rhodopseudomonas telluris]|uniref:Lipoprotein n=1 Tax=Rhodopseudomonas telluris TaxID=644215 RepID=A0ABV6ENC7_9BRAD
MVLAHDLGALVAPHHVKARGFDRRIGHIIAMETGMMVRYQVCLIRIAERTRRAVAAAAIRTFPSRPPAPRPTNQDIKIPMRASSLRLSVAALVGLVLSGLGGCGTINEKLTEGMADHVPQWAGGLPPNAPPRQGTAKYEAYMKEQERRRNMPAAEREKLEGKAGTDTGQAAATPPAR